MRACRRATVELAFLLSIGGAIEAEHPARADVKPLAADVGVDEHVGTAIPGTLALTDQHGRRRRFVEFFTRERPIVLTLAYYHCPGLCDVTLRELATSFRQLDWKLGEDYRALTISIDPHDTPLSASAKRENV
ncbi:MAG TPA: SCO family protein, partial [Polyangiaceae bacterium]|nr:SCO family protein [Polyangiaceae bacterium]